MKECRFCQCDIEEKKAYRIIQPDDAVIYFCPDCAQDLIEYIVSGEAEKANLNDFVGFVPNSSQVVSLWPEGLMMIEKETRYKQQAITAAQNRLFNPVLGSTNGLIV